MNDLIAGIKRLYPTAIYAPPCTDVEIAEAEELLGIPFPTDLRTIYLNFNGFWISGYATAIFPLLPRHHNTSTVKSTLFWKHDPCMPVKESIIFYGMTCRQHDLGIKPPPIKEVVQYSPDYLDGPEVVAATILEAFERDEQWSFDNFGPPPWRKAK